MGKIAFVFAGQGAQYPGMGAQLYEHSPKAKEIFDMADSIRKDTSRQCFHGTKEELSQTENTQPCIYCIDLAAAESLREAGVMPDVVAGFSLGEVPALAFSGAFSYEDGFNLVKKRAQFMQMDSIESNSSMVAVLKLSFEKVEELCSLHDEVYPVNYNSPGQLVVAGRREKLPQFSKTVGENKGIAMPLPVSGGFHSPFMSRASDAFYQELNGFSVKQPQMPVYANNTGKVYGKNIKKQMALQMKNPVLWQKTVENMWKAGVDTFVEVGAGKTLSGLVKKILPEAKIYHVEDRESLMAAISALKKENDNGKGKNRIDHRSLQRNRKGDRRQNGGAWGQCGAYILGE